LEVRVLSGVITVEEMISADARLGEIEHVYEWLQNRVQEGNRESIERFWRTTGERTVRRYCNGSIAQSTCGAVPRRGPSPASCALPYIVGSGACEAGSVNPAVARSSSGRRDTRLRLKPRRSRSSTDGPLHATRPKLAMPRWPQRVTAFCPGSDRALGLDEAKHGSVGVSSTLA